MHLPKPFKLLIIILIILILVALGLILWCKKTAPNGGPIVINPPVDTSDWVTYQNEKYGFEFELPGEFGAKMPTGLQGEDPTKNDPIKNNYLLFEWNFWENQNQKEKFVNFRILNTIDEKTIKLSGGWEYCDKLKEEKVGANNVKIFSIDKGILNMFVINYNNKSFIFIPYDIDDDLFTKIISTFKFIK